LQNCVASCLFASNLRNLWHSKRLADRLLNPLNLNTLFSVAIFSAVVTSTSASPFPSSGPTVPGDKARLRGGQAAAPENAPAAVKRAIWAANQLRSKPYRYGGGHASFVDKGYDCSGTVSYALGGAGLIRSPMSSSDFRRYGQSGRGKWITVYARNGHTFAIIAGLRLDTTPYVTGRERWAPAWQPAPRMPMGFEARHPVGL
jgi:cell wall-associated NlpC family hydrolase